VDFRLAQFTPRSLPFPYPLCLITRSDAMPVMDAILLLMVVARAERTVSFVSITSEGVGCVTGWAAALRTLSARHLPAGRNAAYLLSLSLCLSLSLSLSSFRSRAALCTSDHGGPPFKSGGLR
jgi:hypothetical protein